MTASKFFAIVQHIASLANYHRAPHVPTPFRSLPLATLLALFNYQPVFAENFNGFWLKLHLRQRFSFLKVSQHINLTSQRLFINIITTHTH